MLCRAEPISKDEGDSLKSTLFLIEQLIAILVFAICATICVSIFAASFVESNKIGDMNNSLIIAKNGAECYKAASGNVEKAASLLGGIYKDNEIRVYYDEKRQLCEEYSAVYVLRIMSRNPEETQLLCFGDLSVEENQGEELIAFSVAARRESK